MDPQRIDLSPLDPTSDRQRWERLVDGIVSRSGPELARRAARAGLLGTLGNWLWPALSAAAVLAVISGAAMAVTQDEARGRAEVAGGVVQALDLAAPVSYWLDEDRPPTTSEFYLVLEGESR
jgi:hypothetical protein